MYSRCPPTSIILPAPARATAVAALTVAMPPPIANARRVAITGRTNQRPRPGRWLRTWITIQMAKTARAGGQTQLRRFMTAGPGWKTIRPSPMKPRTAAGTAVQACGRALKRVDSQAIRPHPRPKAKSTDPVTTGSEPLDATVKKRATARAAPATSEPRMARTGEPLLVPRGESFIRRPPRMRANGLAEVKGVMTRPPRTRGLA
jgi:hypothetical protein